MTILKGAALALAGLLASCASTGPKPEEAALETFKQWVRDTVAGNAEASFAGLAPAYQSEWLYLRAADNDGVYRDWRGALTGTARTELDIWYEFCKRTRAKSGRAEEAPASVLRHPSLQGLWKTYFAAEAKAVAFQLSRLEIIKAYADESGVTIAVRSAAQRTELYGLALTGGGWKIDNYRQPNQPVRNP